MLSRAPKRRSAFAALRLRCRLLQTLSLAVFASGALLLGPSARAGNTGRWLIDDQSDWSLSGAYPADDLFADHSGLILSMAGYGPIVNTAMTTATWTGAGTDTTWGNTGNWSTAVPGVPGTGTTTDTSTANFSGVVTNTTPTLEQSYNLQNITFGASGTTLSSYTISNTTGSSTSGNSFLLTSAGTIQFGSGVTGSTGLTQTINAPMVLEPVASPSSSSTGTYAFSNNNTTASNVLSFVGNISGGTITQANTTDGQVGSINLTLSGANTGLNTISGLISDGSSQAATPLSGRGVGIIKTGAGTWYLTNNSNSFTGDIEVSGGILNVSSVANAGVVSAIGAHTSAQDGNNNRHRMMPSAF